jgi:hypothetical protein
MAVTFGSLLSETEGTIRVAGTTRQDGFRLDG